MSLEHPRTIDPDGRLVVFDAGARLHLSLRRPRLLDHIDVIMETVARPDFWVLDPTAGRERFYRQNALAPGRWMRVVVGMKVKGCGAIGGSFVREWGGCE